MAPWDYLNDEEVDDETLSYRQELRDSIVNGDIPASYNDDNWSFGEQPQEEAPTGRVLGPRTDEAGVDVPEDQLYRPQAPEDVIAPEDSLRGRLLSDRTERGVSSAGYTKLAAGVGATLALGAAALPGGGAATAAEGVAAADAFGGGVAAAAAPVIGGVGTIEGAAGTLPAIMGGPVGEALAAGANVWGVHNALGVGSNIIVGSAIYKAIASVPGYDDLPDPAKTALQNLPFIGGGLKTRALGLATTVLGSEIGKEVGPMVGISKELSDIGGQIVGGSLPQIAEMAVPRLINVSTRLNIPEKVAVRANGVRTVLKETLATQQENAKSLGVARGEAGVFMASDHTITHGTSKWFPDDLPGKPKFRQYDISHPDVTYWSIDPKIAEGFAGSNYPNAGARTYPAVLKKGSNVFNPDVDEWPAPEELGITTDMLQQLKTDWEHTKTMGKARAETAFLDNLRSQRYDFMIDDAEHAQGIGSFAQKPENVGFDFEGHATVGDKFVDWAKQKGYQGIFSGNEVAVWDDKAVEPLYLAKRHAVEEVRNNYESLVAEAQSVQRKTDIDDDIATGMEAGDLALKYGMDEKDAFDAIFMYDTQFNDSKPAGIGTHLTDVPQTLDDYMKMSAPPPTPPPYGTYPGQMPNTAEDLAKFTPIPGPTGSNPGGWFKDAFGHEFYMKPNTDNSRVYAEQGTNSVYVQMGVGVANTKVIHDPNGYGAEYILVSQKEPGFSVHDAAWWASPEAASAKAQAKRGWAVDVLLQHYDVVGQDFDNILVSDYANGVMRVEGGAGMGYRAQGGVKEGWNVYGQHDQLAQDVDSMRGMPHMGGHVNKQLQTVFGDIPDSEAADLLETAGRQLRDVIKYGELQGQWLRDGMHNSDIYDNIKVLESKLDWIPEIAKELRGITIPDEEELGPIAKSLLSALKDMPKEMSVAEAINAGEPSPKEADALWSLAQDIAAEGKKLHEISGGSEGLPPSAVKKILGALNSESGMSSAGIATGIDLPGVISERLAKLRTASGAMFRTMFKQLGDGEAGMFKLPQGLLGKPPAANNSTFLGGLQDWDDEVAGVITAGDATNLVDKSLKQAAAVVGINPQVGDTDILNKLVTAGERQKLAGEYLAKGGVSAALDPHAQMFTGRLGHVLKLDRNGMMDVTEVASGVKGVGHILDIAGSDMNKFALKPETKAYLRDFHQLISEADDYRVANGLDPIIQPGGAQAFYVPHQTKTKNGLELDRPANPKLQRQYEYAVDGIADGNTYGNDLRSVAQMFVGSAYREVALKRLNDAAEVYAVTAKSLVKLEKGHETLVHDMATAVQARQQANIRLGRLKVSRPMMAAEKKIRQEVAAQGKDILNTVTDAKVGLKLSADALVGASPAARSEIAAARQLSNDALQKALNTIKTDTKGQISASSLAIVRNAVKTAQDEVATLQRMVGEDVQKGIQSKVVDQRAAIAMANQELARIKGIITPPPMLREQLKADRVKASQQLAVAKANEKALRAIYKPALERAQRLEQVPADIFGKTGQDIKITTWKNKFLPKLGGESLKELAQPIDKPEGLGGNAAKAIGVAANYGRFISSAFDFGTNLILGLNTLGKNPLGWVRITARQLQAFADPAVQGRYIRDHIETVKDMARYGVDPGDTEFFTALHMGGGVNVHQLLAKHGGQKILDSGPAHLAGDIASNFNRQTTGRFEAGYTMTQLANRITLWESATHMSPNERAHWVRNMTGALDTRALGAHANQRNLEGMWMAFSPRLLRSTIALVKDAMMPITDTIAHPLETRGGFGGGVGPTNRLTGASALGGRKAGTESQRAALQSLASLAGVMASAYVMTGVALGKSQEDIETGLNPLNGKRFLSHEVNGDWIGVGGQFRAITQFIGQSAEALKNGGGDFLKLSLTDNPIFAFYNSRGAPEANISATLIEGVSGGKVNAVPFDTIDSLPDIAKHIGTGALPFGLQAVAEGQNAETVAAGMLGARTSPQTQGEERKAKRMASFAKLTQAGNIPEDVAAILKGKEFTEYPSGLRKLIDKDIETGDPKYAEEYRKTRREDGNIYQGIADKVDDVEKTYTEETFQPLFKRLMAGEDPKVIWDAYNNAKQRMAGEKIQIYGRPDGEFNSDEAAEYQRSVRDLPASDIRRWENVYNGITTAAIKAKSGALSAEDWNAVDAEKEALIGRLSQVDPNMAKLLQYNVEAKTQQGLEDGDILSKLRKSAQVQLKPYYDMKDAGADTDKLSDWLHDNPKADFARWMTSSTTEPTLNSLAAIQKAGDNAPNRPARLAGASTPLTGQNLKTALQYTNEIEQIITMPRVRVDNDGKKTYPIQIMRENSALYDALYYWLGYSTPAKGTNTVPVYHAEAVMQFLQQWGPRPDGVLPVQAR